MSGKVPELETSRHAASRLALLHKPAGDEPRFSLGHLWLWLSFAAIDLALVKSLAGNAITGFGLLILSARAITTGAAWAGCAMLISRVCRGKTWSNPGLWLLVVLGFKRVADGLLMLFARGLVAAPHLVVAAVVCCALVLPICSRRLANRWRVAFGVLLALHIVPPLYTALLAWFDADVAWLGGMSGLRGWTEPILGFGLVLTMVLWDRSKGEKYGWLYWVGVAFWLVSRIEVFLIGTLFDDSTLSNTLSVPALMGQ